MNFFIFKNYYNTLIQIRRKQFPVKFNFRNGEVINTNSSREASLLLSRCKGIKFQENRIFIYNKKYNENIILENWKDSVSVKEIFMDNEYESLMVKDKIVLDIGANVGDTAILFSRLGAKKVIALEPQLEFFNRCKKNIEINNLEKKIDIFNAGLDDKRGFFVINEKEDSKEFSFKNTDKGVKIPKMILEDIIPNEKDLILKLDCELCEYNVILNTSREYLQRFEMILIEFHDGNENLIKRLTSMGFKVRVLNSRFTFKKKYRGHLLAVNTNF
ncbi:MAG: FkbM family methyltransferase [Candidatus Nitrosopelagicus sp.]|nr:FkbM family methyltransferase [Candidatus Nitrosopelagicus sp.]